MASALEVSYTPSCHDEGEVAEAMDVAVPEAASVDEDGMVEERAVTVWRVLHFLDEIAEERHVIGVDLDHIRDLDGIVTMMGDAMVSAVDADPGIRPRAVLPGELSAANAGDITLVGDP